MCESLKKAYYNLYMSKTYFCFGPIHLHPQINTHIDINPQKKLIHFPFGVEWLDHLYISWESLLLPIVMLGYFSGRNRQRGIKLFSHNLCTNKLHGMKFFIRFCTRISYVALNSSHIDALRGTKICQLLSQRSFLKNKDSIWFAEALKNANIWRCGAWISLITE